MADTQRSQFEGIRDTSHYTRVHDFGHMVMRDLTFTPTPQPTDEELDAVFTEVVFGDDYLAPADIIMPLPVFDPYRTMLHDLTQP